MKNKSLRVNAVASGVKTVFAVLFPLITYPYITRVLKVDSLGQYSFSYSFISYFYLLASLGISTYAIREGAKHRECEEEFSTFASSVFTINIASTVISYVLLIMTFILIPSIQRYTAIISILSVNMVFTLFGCEWVYSVYEEYVYIAIRSIVFQLVSLVLLFIFVKESADVNKYALVVVFSASGAQLVNWIGLHKYCHLRIDLSRDSLRHLGPILILFANTLAISIYVSADTTILGFVSTDYHVGIYSVATKVYTVVKQVLSSIIVVSIPRLSAYISNNRPEQYQSLGNRILEALTVAVLPAMVGMTCLAEEIVLFIGGKSYVAATSPLIILGVSLVVCMYNWFFTSCVLIPNRKDTEVLTATIAAALINIVLNVLVLSTWFENGAAATTLIAEGCSLVFCMCKSKSLIHIDVSIQSILSTVVGCLFVAVVCLLAKQYIHSTIYVLLAAILISAIGYVAIELILKNRVVTETCERVRALLVHGFKQ